MRQADSNSITLADLTADPVLKAFFRRGPGSEGFTVPVVPPLRPVRPLDGLVRAEIEEVIYVHA
jgi:hypothetical protein